MSPRPFEPTGKMMLNGSYSKLREETDKCIKHLRHEETFFKGVNWDSVRDVDLQVRARASLWPFYPLFARLHSTALCTAPTPRSPPPTACPPSLLSALP